MNVFDAPPRSPRIEFLPPPPMLAMVGTMPAPARLAPHSGKTRTVAVAPPNTTFAPYIPKQEYVPPIPGGGVKKPSGLPFATLVEKSVAEAPINVVGRGKKKRKKAARKAFALLLLVGLAGGGVYAYQTYMPHDSPHPDTWAADVVPLVEFVEHERGLQFDHPVFVDMLPEAEYLARHDGVDEATRTAAVEEAEIMDAFGLGAGYDPLAVGGAINSASTLGTFSPVTGRITLRGTELTPGVRAALVHELTHALQEQHFGLDLDGTRGLAVRSIAEADATRVERAYLVSLPPEEQATAAQAPALAAATAAVPWPVTELAYAPYRLGGRAVMTALSLNGNAGVDDLLSHPPTDRALLSPWVVDAAEAGPMELTAPDGSTPVRDRRSLSMLQMLVVLDAWLPYSVSRDSLDFWVRGDYIAYRPAGDAAMCVRVGVQLAAGGDQLGAAFTYWAAASGSTVTPLVDGGNVTLDLCARGPAAPPPPTPAVGTSQALVIEQAAVPATAVDLQTARPFACATRRLLDDPATAALLAAPALGPAEQAALDQARMVAAQTCAG